MSHNKHGYELVQWLDESHFRAHKQAVLLKDRDGREHKRFVYPDAFCVLRVGQRDAPLFIEAQHYSKPYQYCHKVELYTEYFDSGAFARSFHYEKVRVAAVTNTRTRAVHLHQVVAGVANAGRFWAAAIDDIRADAAGAPVWLVGGFERTLSLV